MKFNSFTNILFVVITILIAAPHIIVILSSFTDFHRDNLEFTVDNYKRVFSDGYFTSLLYLVKRSLIITFISIIIGFFTSIALFKLVADKFLWIFLSILTIPFLINESVRIFSWISIIGKGGILDSFLQYFKIYSDYNTLLGKSEFAIILASCSSTIPLSIFIIIVTLNRINKDIWLAVEDLGLGYFFQIYRVYLPLLSGAILFSIILIFFYSLGLTSEPHYFSSSTRISLTIIIDSMLRAEATNSVMAIGSILIFIIIMIFMMTSKMITKLDNHYE